MVCDTDVPVWAECATVSCSLHLDKLICANLHFLRVESSLVGLSDAAACRTLVACILKGCKLPLMNKGPEHQPWVSTLHTSPPQQPRGQGISRSHLQSSKGGQEEGTTACTAGIQTQCQLQWWQRTLGQGRLGATEPQGLSDMGFAGGKC